VSLLVGKAAEALAIAFPPLFIYASCDGGIMQQHVHTGVMAVLFAGVSAVVVINVTRIVAAKAASSDRPGLQTVGKAVGALVTFA
jgi:hypothetical protein